MWACQKEYSVETGASLSGVAEGTLKDTSGNCFPLGIVGRYVVDTTLKDSNYLQVTVNITTPGNYLIYTDLQNGFSFRDSGVVTATGRQVFKLKGTGKPLVAQVTDFTVIFGTSICTFPITVTANTTGGGGTPAVYTLAGAPGGCTSAGISGTYKVGTALVSSNNVAITVNVGTAGTYSITTGAVNGMTFAASGTFTTMGAQTITLLGTGTPTTAGNNIIPVTAGGTTCSFTIPVAPAGTTGGGGSVINRSDTAWSFNQAALSFRGPFDTAFTATYPGVGFALVMSGASSNAPGDTLEIDVVFAGTSIQTGTYVTTSTTLPTAAYYFYNATGDKYAADPSISGPVMTIVISSYDAATRVLQGTFSGTARNASGASVPITNGRFKAQVN